MAIIDLRRQDGYKVDELVPRWIESLPILPAHKAAQTVLFSFPTAGKVYKIEDVVVQVLTAFTAGTTLKVGLSYIATDAVTTGGAVSGTSDDDEFVGVSAITATTAGYYFNTSASGKMSDWASAKKSLTIGPTIITGAATQVPVIYATLSNGSAITAGLARVRLLVSVLPGVE